MIHPSLFVQHTHRMGKGVFTSSAIRKNQVVEVAPVIVLPGRDRQLLDKTLLHDYIFEWGENRQICVALGYASLYNHAYTSNCEYEMDYEKELITIRAVRHIKPGEELFINYNGDYNNQKRVWFEAK